MDRQNKKESIAALHRENILLAAEKIFSEKGFIATTIDDISKSSEYSRRTIYVYFNSKEGILYHIILKGLFILQKDLMQAIELNTDFLEQYKAICKAMANYQANSPYSFDMVENMHTKDIDINNIPKIAKDIFTAGITINNILAEYIENGKKQGIVRKEVLTMPTVYILWSSISSLLSLAHKKGSFIEREFNMTLDNFLKYGFQQILNSILEVRI
ncbi:MAG: TetR/AcrR family transcriptional regulator [Atribacterota bacterium]|nr:TetR/AcrR family transcriptional regulator [Atribacterota bacterium]